MGNDGEDEQPDTRGNHRMLWRAHQHLRAAPRDLEIHQEQAKGPEHDAGADQAAGAPGRQAQVLGRSDAGDDQRKCRGRQHHSGTKTQQGVAHRHRHPPDHQHRDRPQRRAQRADRTALQGAQQARLQVQPAQPLSHQQRRARQQQQRTEGITKHSPAADCQCFSAHSRP